MPRVGITCEQVAAVADSLLAKDVKVSIKSVRERLGTGSCNTIHRHLSSWRATQPLIANASSDLPAEITRVVSHEIAKAKAEARVELENKLVLLQSEADVLADVGETQDAELDSLHEQIAALVAQREIVLADLVEKDHQIGQLSRENERERTFAEQARIELAQVRNRVDLQTEKLSEQSGRIEKMTNKNADESQARIAAEREAAVLASKLEVQMERAENLFHEKEELVAMMSAERLVSETGRIEIAKVIQARDMHYSAFAEALKEKKELIAQIDAERTLSEANRIEIIKITHALEMQSVAMIEKNTVIEALSISAEAERKARSSAETNVAVLMSRLEAYEKQNKLCLQP